jgi:hypothetical protein
MMIQGNRGLGICTAKNGTDPAAKRSRVVFALAPGMGLGQDVPAKDGFGMS